MARELWWATLDSHSPRYREWYGIFENDRVPLVSPFSVRATLGPEKDIEVYKLDWIHMTSEQQSRLLCVLAKKFNESVDGIRTGLDREGMPIRAADVYITYDMRAFL